MLFIKMAIRKKMKTEMEEVCLSFRKTQRMFLVAWFIQCIMCCFLFALLKNSSMSVNSSYIYDKYKISYWTG